MTPRARVIRVIEVTHNRGKGVKDDPVRRVVTYYDLDGAMLAEFDPADDAANIAEERFLDAVGAAE